MQEKELEIRGGSLYYIRNADGVTITCLKGPAEEVLIPDEIEETPVTAVGKKAFLSKKNLRKVRLPDSVEEVGDWAFAYCDGLERVFLPGRAVRFGRAVFLDCGRLRFLDMAGKNEDAAALLAAAVTTAQAYYLLEPETVGTGEWLAKWDARMMAVLHEDDGEGYARQILCGEEDYGSTDLNAYMNEKRKVKVRLALLRLRHPMGLTEETKKELTAYLQQHTKGCESEETWQVILSEHGDDNAYYRIFAQLNCVNADNFEALIADIGERYPEMKAFFMRYKEENIGYTDFFGDLQL